MGLQTRTAVTPDEMPGWRPSRYAFRPADIVEGHGTNRLGILLVTSHAKLRGGAGAWGAPLAIA